MRNHDAPTSDEVEQLLLNAQLRDDLEPYIDESLDPVAFQRLPTSVENDFLQAMLDWERAPVLPISKWFEPELAPPAPDQLDDEQLGPLLWHLIEKLHEKYIVLDFTDHLSDRQLYCLIYRDILPSHEKRIENPKNYLHWHCLDVNADAEPWLRYYASEGERMAWSAETGQPLPPSEPPPFRRKLPRRPL